MPIKNLVPFGKKSVSVRRENENSLFLLRREMDSLFDSFFRGLDTEPFESRVGAFSPKVDVTENEKEIKISAELPGMDEKDIDISLQHDVLIIKGEKNEEKEDKEKTATAWNVLTAPSVGLFPFPLKWRPLRWRLISKKAC